MDQVLTYDKSLQQRLQEYRDVLSSYELLPVSAIQKEWSFYLDLTLDSSGWQAVWKIPRKTCETLNIPFPTVVLVVVLELFLETLTALVEILAVQDDIHIPQRYCVDLTNLWPTKNQDKTICLNLQSTANSIDMLRFFYNHLFMPWDLDDDDGIDWKSAHLEARLRLFYDLRNGVLPRVTAEHLNCIVAEAKRLRAKQEGLQAELQNNDVSDEETDEIHNEKLQVLMELHVRMMEIKAEMDVLENPLLRTAIIKKHREMSHLQIEIPRSIWVIYNQGTARDCISFLSQVNELYPKDVLKFLPQLSSLFEFANQNDICILNEDKHLIKAIGALENGGILKGVANCDKTILQTDVEDIMLDFRGEDVLLENLTIEAVTPQCAVIIRSGKVTLKNCKIIGDGKSSTHQGILVLNGGHLILQNCEISRFYSAVIGNTGSSISIENSEIHDCHFGIKLYDNSIMKAVNSAINNCKEYGIYVETDHDFAMKNGNFNILTQVPNLQMNSLKGISNFKGDASINKKIKLQALDDIFTDRDLSLNSLVGVESDEDMEDFQKTVVTSAVNGSSTTV